MSVPAHTRRHPFALMVLLECFMATTSSSIADILAILIRRGKRLAPGPLAIYNVLYQAGDRGVSERALVDRVRDGNLDSFQKVLRGISRRVKETRSVDVGRDDYRALLGERLEGADTVYFLRPEVREAMQAEPEYRRLMEMPVATILAMRNPDDPQRDQSRWPRIR